MRGLFRCLICLTLTLTVEVEVSRAAAVFLCPVIGGRAFLAVFQTLS